MADFIDAQGFRANVGIVLIRDGGEVFLGSRSDGRGWQFPQGGVQREESPEEALFRELHEEIGLGPEDVEVIATTRDWLRYRLPRQYVRRRSRPLCIGQKQRWFLLRMLGDEGRLRFDTTERPEFDDWRWVDYWSPVREVIFFKRIVYARALRQREWQVLWMITTGLGNAEIAEAFSISKNTVEKHLSRLMAKLHQPTRPLLQAFVYKEHLEILQQLGDKAKEFL
jgi:putative (di)nucleoside polyphosphate hydrolase